MKLLQTSMTLRMQRSVSPLAIWRQLRDIIARDHAEQKRIRVANYLVEQR